MPSSCPDCHHDAHGAGPCTACTAAGNGTCWQPLLITGGDGDRTAASRIDMPLSAEPQPCYACRSWEKDTRRLIGHLRARGLVPAPDGSYETPIAKDFAGRKSLKIFPQMWGFCRYEVRPTQDEATCPAWQPVKSASELADRLR